MRSEGHVNVCDTSVFARAISFISHEQIQTVHWADLRHVAGRGDCSVCLEDATQRALHGRDAVKHNNLTHPLNGAVFETPDASVKAAHRAGGTATFSLSSREVPLGA